MSLTARGRLVILAGGAMMTFLGAAGLPPDSIPLDAPKAHLYVHESDETAMVDAINTFRAAHGVPKLTTDPKLTCIARDYAREMFENGYFGHIDPSGRTPLERLNAAGYVFHIQGENIAFKESEEAAEAGLEASPGHRRNMLERAFTRVGVGVIADSVYGSIFVQEFAGD